jgi:hypothetical protein
VGLSFKRESFDIAFEFDSEHTAKKTKSKREELDDMFAHVREIFREYPELLEEYDVTFPVTLSKFWSQKKNRSYLKLSVEVASKLAEMFTDGQGMANKALRWSAERAASTLQTTMLKDKWDQLLICTISKVKSVFSRKHQVEQSQNDTNRRTLEAESEEARADRARLLLEENAKCERALIQLMGGGQEDVNAISFEGIEMKHFLQMKPQLLKAFIKARVLEDATATELDKMPKKGTIGEAKKGEKCKRTSKPVMIRWAYDLCQHPVKARIPVHQGAEQAEMSQVQHLFTRTDDEGEAEVDFLDDLQQDILIQRDAGIQDESDEDSNDESPNEEDLDSDSEESND